MKKKIYIPILLTIAVLITSALALNSTERIPLIEDTFDKFISYYSQPIETFYWMTDNGDCLYRIENNNLCLYTTDLTPINQVQLPFTDEDVYTVDLFSDKFLIISVTNHLENAIQKLYRVDLTNRNVTCLNTEPNTIYEIDGFYTNPNALYVKYISLDNNSSAEKRYYGYMDPKTGKCTPISEITEDNKFDIYAQEQLILKLNMEKSDVDVQDASGKALFSFPRALYSKQYASSNRFRKLMNYEVFSSNTIYYIDPNKSIYGTLMKFDGISQNAFEIPHLLKGNVTGILQLENDGLLINYGDDGYCELYDPNASNLMIRDLIANNDNMEILKVSSDSTKVLFLKNATNGNTSLQYSDLKAKKNSILSNYKHLIPFKKLSTTIKDEKNRDLQFYLMKHEDTLKRPVAIFIHGGPFSRFDQTGFDESHLLLYELGFNVIQLNFHGSTNLGLSYYKNAAPNIAKATVENVSTVLSWIETQPTMDSDQIALLGTSYGGYATMICKMAMNEKIKVAVAMLPASIDDFSLYQFDVFEDLLKGPSNYDNWELAKTTNQPIGIVFAPFDSQLRGSKDWNKVSRDNKNIHILKTLGSKHTVSLRDFKHVVYYINQYIPLPAMK